MRSYLLQFLAAMALTFAVLAQQGFAPIDSEKKPPQTIKRSPSSWVFTAKLGCHDTQVHIPKAARILRLKLAPCFDERTKITNKNNGFTATLLKNAKGDLTSDLISLTQGDNTLDIAHLKNKKKRESSIPILRSL